MHPRTVYYIDMDSFKKLKELTHHAYYLLGGYDELLSILEKNHGLTLQGNPDFFNKTYEIFTVDDARELKTAHSMRPVHSSGKKIFVVQMNGITTEAQNALLKLLEEPAEYAHFFLIIPSAHLLLPTVKSRLSFIETGAKSVNELGNESVDAKAFLKASQPKRLDIIKKLVEDISKEKKTRQDAITFLNAIEKEVYEQKGVKNGAGALEVISKASSYMNDRAPSVKMLLEYVAMNVWQKDFDKEGWMI